MLHFRYPFLFSMSEPTPFLARLVDIGLVLTMWLPGPAAMTYGLVAIARRKLRLTGTTVLEGRSAVAVGLVLVVLGATFLWWHLRCISVGLYDRDNFYASRWCNVDF